MRPGYDKVWSMAVSIKVGLQQTQKLALTQSLRQSIEMLQLSTLELAETIAQELLENPVIEEADTAALPSIDMNEESLIARVSQRLSGDDSVFDRREENDVNFADSSDSGYSGGFDEEDRKRKFLENAVTQEETLKEHLLAQARLAATTEKEFALFESIITSIDDSGLLADDVEKIAAENSISAEAVKDLIAVIGGFDPVGCGAPSVRESLLLQAAFMYPADSLLKTIISEYFREMERLDYEKIARSLSITLADVIEKSRLVHTLTPFPGRQFSMKGIRYIIPDVEVRYVAGEIVVAINDDWIPQIGINTYYINLLKKKNIDKKLKEYIKDKLQSARHLLKNISSRRDTIVKVVSAIMDHQREFLVRGHGHLKPLTHAEIAAEVGLHESTVSRVTSNKFVQTNWGVFELKFFFVSKIKSDNAEEHSSDRVMSLIKDIVAGEDQENPLSDEEILDRLRNAGINLARRTIAKYRGVLQIPSSTMRKKLNMIRSEVKI